MNSQLLKEEIAKDITYAFWAFAPVSSEQEQSVYMKRNIYPAKRDLIDYAGVKNPQEVKQSQFVTPLEVLYNSVEDAIGAFYDDMRQAFSLETGNKLYDGFQTRMKEGLDRSEQRLVKKVKEQVRISAAQKGLEKILPAITESVDGEMRRVEQLTEAETRQFLKDVLLLNYQQLGYENYRFVTEGENCEDCNAFANQVLPISQAEAGINLAPMHPNCNCRTGILDENGKIAFYAEDDLSQLLSDFDFSRQPDDRFIQEIQQKFTQLFDFTMPWMREDLGEETDHSMKEISEEEALFLSKLQMIGISFELSLAILSEMRRTGGDIPKEKYESWGFADAFSMGYVELQYQLTQEGMTVEQVDYLESDARFSLALQVTAINLAIAGIKVIGQITSSEQADPELESQTTAKTGNKISDPTAEQRAQGSKGTIETKNLKDLPQNVQNAYNGYKQNGWKGNYSGQTKGTNAGRVWENEFGDLPTQTSNNTPITYKEFDVNNKVAGQARDGERFIFGSDGSVYFSPDHYITFIKIQWEE